MNQGKAKVLITGGSGLLGTRLTELLLSKGYQVAHLARKRHSKNGVKVYEWDPSKNKLEKGALHGVDYIIHLAGEGIADKKWTQERKTQILQSRIQGPRFLLEEVKKHSIALKGFFSASGINYFDQKSDVVFEEQDAPGKDFVADVVVQWEQAAMAFGPLCRVAMFRFGMILDRNEGGLPKISFPVQFGFGTALGSGKQWMNWIHIEDAARCFVHAIENETIQGPYNAVAPQHVNNKEFTREVGKAIGMPVFMPNVPAFVLKLVFGELSELVKQGSRASSKKLSNSGFIFHHPELREALQSILKGSPYKKQSLPQKENVA
jgi:uncharacterized protein (TIGR01777 family)